MVLGHGPMGYKVGLAMSGRELEGPLKSSDTERSSGAEELTTSPDSTRSSLGHQVGL